ncbi:OLC1v1024644C1 [Oldenlandia corymbosa var. corymbosa]|uniref:OLC1v1024644C1 n=1 Tax=Oldenlandia corymbosa var. corymbosa TaxID=529605 RepID=A0AAV1C2Z4_OLDCO|nr:OLC1v1024644C1 [Oldenlandia corymbosa var. corymbosa]
MMIPVISLAGETAKPGTSSWVAACEKVKAAMEEYGCFVAIHDLFTSEDSASVFKALKDVFGLPVEAKKKNVFDNPMYGYRTGPLTEMLGVFDAAPHDVEEIQSFTNLMWPSGNPSFCEIMYYFAKKFAELDRIVTRMIYESYGVEKCFDRDCGIASFTHLLRMINYRVPQSSDQSNVGITPHTDKSLLTILHQNQVNGLEVKTKDGKWINLDLPPSSLLVMAGDSLSGWSNGRIHAPVHQVKMRGEEERFTLSTFSFHKGLIQVPEELVDDEHPLLYKPFSPIKLLEFFGTKEGRQAEDLLNAYCGV